MTIVIDTSAFISLASGDVLSRTVHEFDVVTTTTVFDELAETATYTDSHGRGAATALDTRESITVETIADAPFETSRIDPGEASCVAAVRNHDAAFLITDDFRALPELRQLVTADVALSPIVLRALVKRGVLERSEADGKLEAIAEQRDWLGAPIYRFARQLFDG